MLRRNLQRRFLALLPTIERCAHWAFLDLPADAHEEAVQDVICNALLMFTRLADQRRERDAYATSLADYAIRQTRGGRKLGASLNADEVLSHYAQRRRGFAVRRLDVFDPDDGWKQVVVEDTHTDVPEQAAFRIDFPRWLGSHTRRNRRIAVSLSCGCRTNEVADRFGLSEGRISQLRDMFGRSWLTFHAPPSAEVA